MSRLTIAAGALGAAAIVGVPLGIAAASPGTNDSATRRSDTTNTHQENGNRRAYPQAAGVGGHAHHGHDDRDGDAEGDDHRHGHG